MAPPAVCLLRQLCSVEKWPAQSGFRRSLAGRDRFLPRSAKSRSAGRKLHQSPRTKNGIFGDGSRVPAIVIGPFAKRGFVDHSQHDTLSILKTIERTFGPAPLNTFDANASSLDSSLILGEAR
ncbi:MAG: hypothetical protein DMG86_13150 [Acidobacteria bacterium]|nr:MAG: hypothetical protein DMG86_13150 [Acidobacteriota bacterium]